MAKEIATFAGGCFWCMVKPFDSQPGIESVISGYTGGHKENPTYKEVCSGTTGHTEAVQITFDPEVFPYEKLVEVYWQQSSLQVRFIQQKNIIKISTRRIQNITNVTADFQVATLLSIVFGNKE